MIALDTGTVALLTAHRERQQSRRHHPRPGWIDTDLVFTQPGELTALGHEVEFPRIRSRDLRHGRPPMRWSGVDSGSCRTFSVWVGPFDSCDGQVGSRLWLMRTSWRVGVGMDSLVSARWLAEHLGDPHLRVFDATVQVRRRLGVPMVRVGEREWRRGHIPGSAFASLFALSDPDRSRRSMTMPSPDRFAAGMGALGAAQDSHVVLYDRRESMWAARLWWMLRTFGFDQAAVLDGGWTAWQQGGHPICSTPCSYPPGTFIGTLRPELVVGKQEVLAAIGDPAVCLINALGRRQHRGAVNEYGRRGHIPGSRNVTAWEILDRQTQRYRALPELRRKVGSALDAERIITYCGAGAAASSLAHVLVRLGHPRVAVYDGGLLEWCADRSLPLETRA